MRILIHNFFSYLTYLNGLIFQNNVIKSCGAAWNYWNLVRSFFMVILLYLWSNLHYKMYVKADIFWLKCLILGNYSLFSLRTGIIPPSMSFSFFSMLISFFSMIYQTYIEMLVKLCRLGD